MMSKRWDQVRSSLEEAMALAEEARQHMSAPVLRAEHEGDGARESLDRYRPPVPYRRPEEFRLTAGAGSQALF